MVAVPSKLSGEERVVVLAYARATRCPVLTGRTGAAVLRACYAKSGSDISAAGTGYRSSPPKQ
eukprot:1821488-Rhodomonas_salina.3